MDWICHGYKCIFRRRVMQIYVSTQAEVHVAMRAYLANAADRNGGRRRRMIQEEMQN